MTTQNGDTANLHSNVEINSVPLTGVSDAGDDPEVLGFAVMATTGELLVPRTWLEEKWEKHGLNENILPSETWNSSAYKRAMFHLFDDTTGLPYLFEGHRYDMQVKKGDGNQRHIIASVWFPNDPENEDIDEGGEWRSTTLGYCNYDADAQDMTHTQRIPDEHPLSDLWDKVVSKARDDFEEHKVSHNGDDLRDVLYDFTRFYSDSIPLRDGGAVYFVPAHEVETIQALASIWDAMDEEYKVGGRKTEIRTIPVISDTERKEMIEERATQVLREEVDRILTDAFEDLDDEEKATPEEEIVETIEDSLADHVGTAEAYNALLNAKIDVRSILRDFASRTAEDAREELIEETLTRLDLKDDDDSGAERDEQGRFV